MNASCSPVISCSILWETVAVPIKNQLNIFFVYVLSVFAGCQIPYPKREFLSEDEPEEKTEKVTMPD